MKRTSVIDLTLPIISGGSAPPKMPRPEFELIRTMENDGCRTSKISFYNHSGTHMDSPSHFLDMGKTIDELSLEQCIGNAFVVNVSSLEAGQRIQVEDLDDLVVKLEEGWRLLFYTGWERFYPEDAYYHHFPAVSLELAYWMVEKKVALVGIDTSSVAAVDNWDELTAVHKVLLSNGIIIVEGLSNLNKLPFGKQVELICLPMKLADTDGAPARAVAILEEEL
jgi:arylformamidase